MFEYLMPLLVMPTYENTLLDQTCRAVVERQIEYGRERGVPWGISESGYNDDRRAPELSVPRVRRARPGLQARPGGGPGDRAVRQRAGADGGARSGVREPAAPRGRRAGRDATASTRRSTTRRAAAARAEQRHVVRSFMAHHQGMALLSLAYLLLDRPMQRRFESDPAFQATELLLQERVPKAAAVYPHPAEVAACAAHAARSRKRDCRVFTTPNTPAPEVQLLSNGRYHVDGHAAPAAATAAGATWRSTRWREDPHARLLGHVLLPARRRERRVLVDRVSADAQASDRATRRSSRKAAPNSAAATATSTRTPRSASRPKTTSSCAASASPTAATRRARSS